MGCLEVVVLRDGRWQHLMALNGMSVPYLKQ